MGLALWLLGRLIWLVGRLLGCLVAWLLGWSVNQVVGLLAWSVNQVVGLVGSLKDNKDLRVSSL